MQPCRSASRDDRALEIIDFGPAALLQILPHRGARLRIDLHRPPQDRVEDHVGQSQQGRRPVRRDWRRRGRRDAGGPERGETFRHLVGEQSSPGALRQLRRSGTSDSALSALLRLMISLPHCTPAMSRLARIVRPGTESDRRCCLRPLDDDVAGGRTVETSFTHCDHIERHHTGEHAPARLAPAARRHCRHRSARPMTASGGACCAIWSATSAVSALLTVTSTMPALRKMAGSSDSARRSAASFFSAPSKSVSRRPNRSISASPAAAPVTRPSRRHRHATDKTADGAGAGHPDRSIRVHSAPSDARPSIAERRCRHDRCGAIAL